MASNRRDISRIKPVPSQVQTHRTNSPATSDATHASSTSSICRVCRRAQCRLQSHKAYIAHQRKFTTETPPAKSSELEAEDRLKAKLVETTYAKSYAYTKTPPSLGAGRLDGFNDLPVPGGHQLDLHQSVYNRESQSLVVDNEGPDELAPADS